MTFFVLGVHPELSLAELKAVLGDEYRPVCVSNSVVVIETIDRSPDELQERLAGIVKIGQIVGELVSWDQEAAADLVASLASEAAGKNKISFGLSVYDTDDGVGIKRFEKELDALGLEIKKRLKTFGRPVRYVKGKEPRLSSAIVQTNGLLESGGEFVLLVARNKIFVGQTQTIQDFRAWEARDFGRPARDAKSGMLPPKLARMMINLAGIDPAGATLLDPFCGSGTVLMEGALMGFKELLGSDISEKAVDATKKNLAWIHSHFSGVEHDGAKAPVKLFVSSAQTLDQQLGESVDLLVTEVFLGAPRTSAIDSQEAHRLETELLPLYHDSFAALKTLLKPAGRAVVAFPAFKKIDGSWHRLPIQSLLENLGYNILENHLYFRSEQLVARDIYVLTLK